MSFVETLVRKYANQSDVGFIVGSGLTCPTRDHPGVPGCVQIVREVQARNDKGVAAELEALMQQADIAAAYQRAIRSIRENGEGTLRDQIRKWTREAYQGSQNSVRGIHTDHKHWRLRPGVIALGALLTKHPNDYSFAVTTNFDPMIEVAVHKAGGIPSSVVFNAHSGFAVDIGRVPVLHVHGFWTGETLHSDDELASPRPTLERLMVREFESISAVQVVIGYGGWTDNVMHTLADGLADEGQVPDVHWCLFESGDAAEEREREIVRQLLRFAPGAASVIPHRLTFHHGVDADRDLPLLEQRVRALQASTLNEEVDRLRSVRKDLSERLRAAADSGRDLQLKCDQQAIEIGRLQGRLSEKDREIADAVKEIVPRLQAVQARLEGRLGLVGRRVRDFSRDHRRAWHSARAVLALSYLGLLAVGIASVALAL